jgi:hypothetical protein
MASTTPRVLTLQSLQAAGSQLSIRYSYGKHRFSLSYWYDFDLESLDGIYGSDFMEKVYTHCAAFSIFHLCSLKPDLLDWGPYSRWHTAEFERVWNSTWSGLSGQWRYENDLPDINAPVFTSKPSSATNAITIEPQSPPTTLAFFGGGKDSLVMYELLSRSGVPFSSVSYSHTVYGRSSLQHQLCDKVPKLLNSEYCKLHHKLCIMEDFLDSPVLESIGKQVGVKSFMEGETPASLFSSLPIVLYYRYTSIAIGNERGSNVGNLVWECTGEDINHQWGKSREAEILFGGYIQQALISNTPYFSVLQPLYDAVIFSVASNRLEAAICTHSCNIIKPWCKRCPKCCYIWLMFTAFFPRDAVDEMFQGANLLDIPENEIHFVQMLGLGSNKPFECVGDFDEAKLGFELCRRKGLQGKAMEIYKEKLLQAMDEKALAILVSKYTTVYTSEPSNAPPAVWDRLLPILKQAAVDARKRIEAELSRIYPVSFVECKAK